MHIGIPKEIKDHECRVRDGLNVLRGRVTHPAVAADLGYAVEPLQTALAA